MSAQGFVVLEGRTREGSIVRIPYGWRCARHKDPSAAELIDMRQGFERRFGYDPPLFAPLPGAREVSVVWGFSQLTPDEAAQLQHDYDTIAKVEGVQALDVPVDVVHVRRPS